MTTHNPPQTAPQPPQDSTPSPAQAQPLPPPAALPRLPDDLAAPLKPRDIRLALALVDGLEWPKACDTVKLPQDHPLRKGPPDRIRKAAEWWTRHVMHQAGINKSWLITELVSLYKLSLTDVRGYSTARGCLFLLGSDLGMFTRARGEGIPAGEVAELMRAVAARGSRARPAIAAPHPTGKSANGQGNESA